MMRPEHLPGENILYKILYKYYKEKTEIGVVQRSLLVFHFNYNLLVGAGICYLFLTTV